MKVNHVRRLAGAVAATLLVSFPGLALATYAEGEAAYLKGETYPAFLKFVEMAKEKDARSEAMVARIYLEGSGAPRSVPTAATFYARAAEQGNATAQFQLARFYLVGAAVKQDPARAAELMEKSANQGVIWAMVSLGQMYKDGTGVAKDPVQALKWMTLAAAIPENDVTAEYVKQAKAAKAELQAGLAADGVQQSEKQVKQWNAAKRVRDDQWQKALNHPLEVRADPPRAENTDGPKQFTRDYFPGAK